MPARVSFGSVRLTAGGEPADLTPADGTPFRVLVVADFGGNQRPGSFRPVRVDRDNFDTLPGKLGVTVRVPGTGELSVREMDDFHPDRLWSSVPAFDELRSLRRRLQNPKTFADAAAVVASWDQPTAVSKPAADAPRPEAPSLLEDVFGKSIGEIVASSAPDGGELGAFLRATAAKYAVPADDPRRGDLTRRVEAAAAGVMREILHHPRFQAVEAAWRGLGFLVRRLDTDAAIHLYLLDVSRDELAADLATDDLSGSKLYDVLVRRELETAGGVPWALVVGGYTFGPAAADAELLARIGAVVARTGAGFVAGGSPGLVGCTSFAATPDPDDWRRLSSDDAEAWQELRRQPEAAHLGLATPRFLLRAPYGEGSGTAEGFDFEESPAGHEEFLWGNAAFAWAYLLGEAFERAGWRLGPAVRTEVAELPLAVVERDGDKEAVPCAEVPLTNDAAARIEAAGLSALRSVRDADRAEFASLVSLAVPTRPLAGRWT